MTDKWQIEVMVSRSWTSVNPYTNRVMSLDIIFSDECGASIHAKIRSSMIKMFSNTFQEGRVYKIHKFVVIPYETMYRPLRRDTYVQFTRATTVYNSQMQLLPFTRYVLDVVPFDQLRQRVNDDMYLTDVIGILREWGDVKNLSRSSLSVVDVVRNIVISNECGKEIGVSLWGRLATLVTDEDILSYVNSNIVVTVTSCKVRLFKGCPSLMTTVGSQLNFNLPVPLVDSLKNLECTPIIFKRNEEHDGGFEVTSISDIYGSLYEGVKEGTMFNIVSTIIDIDMSEDWKYVQCSTCRKKTILVEGRYFCRACEKNIVNPEQAYKLVIRVIDKGEEMLCVLFNDAALPLLGISAGGLISKSLSEGADDPHWIHDYFLEHLCAQQVIIRIKVDKYNNAPNFNRRFTVSKYFGDDLRLVKKVSTFAPAATNSPVRSSMVTEIGEVVEGTEMSSRITHDDLVDLAHCKTPGPSTCSVSSVAVEPRETGVLATDSAALSSVYLDNPSIGGVTHDIQGGNNAKGKQLTSKRNVTRSKKFVVLEDEVGESGHDNPAEYAVDLATQSSPSFKVADCGSDGSSQYMRPKRNVKKPKRFI
ncbi:hypothetical protein L1987_37293 [Smallanthus sonchifolius]|uniref:Uncharacterized protein n=1 Tax=Smallanthus sonchifolius TaxID=185202 RepID=A0ACB9HHR9_9ASTR|nr:hypothetical protein L1987_37293 [Smallanthus sonchifolius]